jgi:hypothetical protein
MPALCIRNLHQKAQFDQRLGFDPEYLEFCNTLSPDESREKHWFRESRAVRARSYIAGPESSYKHEISKTSAARGSSFW